MHRPSQSYDGPRCVLSQGRVGKDDFQRQSWLGTVFRVAALVHHQKPHRMIEREIYTGLEKGDTGVNSRDAGAVIKQPSVYEGHTNYNANKSNFR